jgi:hypothetical protein
VGRKIILWFGLNNFITLHKNNAMGTQFLTDEKGKRTAVVLPIEKYNKLMEHLDDLEDVRLYDEAKREDDGTRISIDEAFKIIEAKRKKVV